MNPEFPYKYICIEGNIGSGKTSFCKQLAQQYLMELVLEQFSENPFLSHFYENPSRYALPVELFFMTERFNQISASMSSGQLFSPVIVSDYFFDKTRLFAHLNLNEMEYRLFLQIYDTLAPLLRPPDLVVYIHRPVEQLKDHIHKRGRSFEQQISTQYLQSIQDRYFDYFRMEMDFPVVIVNAEQLHFTDNHEDFIKLAEILQKEYTRRVHRVSFIH